MSLLLIAQEKGFGKKAPDQSPQRPESAGTNHKAG
jgi:hypothetical protein